MPVSGLNRSVSRLTLTLAIAPAVTGCGDSTESASFTVADSAGITIVTNEGPRWDADEGWTLAAEPTVEIGIVEGDPNYQFSGVIGATRLADGRIVVLDQTTAELRFFDRAGTFLMKAGGHGQGPGELRRPVSLIRQAGDTLLVDAYHGQESSWFTPEGSFARFDRLNPNYYDLGQVWGCPMATALLPDGSHLLCVGSVPERRQHPDVGRAAHHLVRVPYDLSWADTIGVAYGGSSRLGFGAPETAIAAGGDPLRVFLGDPAHFEIEVVNDREGRSMSIRYPKGLRPVTEETTRAYIAEFEEARKSPPPAAPTGEQVSWAPIPEIFASTFPGFTDLIYDEAGYLWAVQSRATAEEPASALVFTESGELLGSVGLPDRFIIREIGEDYVLGVRRDEFDVEYVTVHGLDRG